MALARRAVWRVRLTDAVTERRNSMSTARAHRMPPRLTSGVVDGPGHGAQGVIVVTLLRLRTAGSAPIRGHSAGPSATKPAPPTCQVLGIDYRLRPGADTGNGVPEANQGQDLAVGYQRAKSDWIFAAETPYGVGELVFR